MFEKCSRRKILIVALGNKFSFFLNSGEVFICEREPNNASDRYAIAVKRKGTIVGHLPVIFPLLGFTLCPSPLALFGPPYWSELELAMELGNSKILEDQEDHP